MSSRVKLEVEIEEAVCQWARKNGWIAAKLVNLGERGWPDRWFLHAGPVIVLIEFKRPGQKPRKLQEYVCNQLRNLGLEVHAGIDNYEEAISILGAAQLSAESNVLNAGPVKSGTEPRSGDG